MNRKKHHMNLTPGAALSDLESYLSSYGFRLSESAFQLIQKIENFAYQHKRDLYEYIVLNIFLRELGELRSLMLRKGADPEEAIDLFNTKLHERSDDDPYDHGHPPYSNKDYRGGFREQIADFSMAVARRDHRSEILEDDILAGYLEAHDENFPAIENGQWADEALHVTYNTLSHIHGRYFAPLWVKFEDIREELGLVSSVTARRAPLDSAPAYLKPSVMAFLSDHQDYRNNCFLIMPFTETEFYKNVHLEVRSILSRLGFKVHRADDKAYTNDVFTNIETYIYGCKFGISVHDRVMSDAHNPNISLEVGYMLGQKKEVCLLKEKTVQRLPSDLQGRLYVEFDAFNIKSSLEKTLEKWLKDKRIIRTQNRGQV